MPIVDVGLSCHAFLSSGRLKQAQRAAQASLNALADRLRQGEMADLKLSISSSVTIGVDVVDTLISHAVHGEGALGRNVSNECALLALATHG